jgi:mono/diheme cytochrome c family protein
MPGNIPHTRLARVLGACLLASLLLVLFSSAAWAQEGDITRGSQIYDANCAVCHGAEGQGRVGVNLSNDWPAIDPTAFTRAVIEQGVSGTPMTPWSQQYGGPLDEQEIEDVVAFVTSLSGGRSDMAPTATPFPVTPVPTVPGSTGDPTQGSALFVQNCAMCHGESGQGRSGASLSAGFSSINPQQFVRATVAQGIDNTAMPAWSQSYGGPLTESEIDDISAFIITLPSQAQPTPAPAATPVPTDSGGGTNWLVILLVLVAMVVVILLIIAFSGRGGETT